MGNLLTAKEVIDFAIHIEQNGYKFYVEALKKIKDPDTIKLFQFLADEEFKHEETFKLLKRELGVFTPHESYDGEYQNYMNDFLQDHTLGNNQKIRDMLNTIESQDDALEIALRFEKDSVVFFSVLKGYVSSSQTDAVEKIIKEEVSHIIKLNAIRNKAT